MVFFRVHEESLTTAFGNLACIVDELNALWRVASQTELAGVLSVRAACNASIAARAAEVLRPGPAENRRPSLGKDDFETMLRRNAKDSKDEEDIRARVHVALGDALYWDGEYDNARRSYWLGIRLRPWRLKSWSKYLLLQMGSVGMCIRGLLFQLRQLKSRAA
jgi:hypothetical protein